MKILAIGDPHGKLPSNLDTLVKNKIDIIVCIGEVFPVGRDKKNQGQVNLKAGERTIDKMCSYGLPVIIFKGNMFLSKQGAEYFRNLLKKYKKKYKKLYYKRIGKLFIKKVSFILFDMIYEEHSHQFLPKNFTSEIKNEKLLIRLNKLLKQNPKAILLSHAPPYGYLDKIHSGKKVGSKILLKAIQKNKPKLVLCGHIHEAKGSTNIGRTEIYNLGCSGDYKIIETDSL